MKRRTTLSSLAIFAVLGLLAAMPSAWARTCAQVQTDLDAQYKARAMYMRELGSERDPGRRGQLVRGVEGFDRNIDQLRREPCDGGQVKTQVVPPIPSGVTDGASSGPGTITNLDGE